jgi:hypothetical protein
VTPATKSVKVTTFIKKESSSAMNKKKILREGINQIPHKKVRVSNPASSSSAIASTSEKEGYVNDSELPCCSRSITSFIYKPPSPSSSSSSSTGQVKITSFLPIKKVGVKFSSNAGGSKPTSTLKKGRSLTESTTSEGAAPTFHSLSEKLLKKKKRLLKSETTTGLKRKKSRPQKPLV